jgi:non-specific serine/threonine protein kinase/serine/threonine-protein kinase
VDPARWQRINDLFEEAIRMDREGRAELLARSSREDAALRIDLEALIEAHETAGDFILESPLPPASEVLAETLRAGMVIGAYRILREIGRGGMGTVYLAERVGEYQQVVAIKIVGDALAGDEPLRRFRNERQILANLDHPRIARLLDGGTTLDHSPYLVMEYIDGQPITEYCDQRRLSIAARLRLFREVCAAVHHAHQNLIVHRDLKPGNILITSDGSPKLLDFGVAKLLGAQSAGGAAPLTRTGLVPMTPEYASPEQVRGEQVTTAGDVYSLGVLLFELLCGERPYALSGLAPSEVERTVCLSEVKAPSARTITAEVAAERGTTRERLKRALRGDLDTIVAMAMRVEPRRRYASAAELAEDIQRHLDGLPVIARIDTLSYRFRKFVGRHRVGVLGTLLTALGLQAGLVVALWQRHEAQLQRSLAEKRRDDAHRFALTLIGDIHDTYNERSRTVSTEQLIQKGVAYLDSLARESDGDVLLRRDLAEAYGFLARVQGYPIWAHSGNQAKARENYLKAIAILESLQATAPYDRETRLGLSSDYVAYALSLAPSSAARSLQMHRRAQARYEEFANADPDRRELRLHFALASSLELVGERYGHPYYANVGDTAQALAYCQRAFEMRLALDAVAARNGYAGLASPPRHDVGDSYNLMAGVLWAIGKLDLALQYQETGLVLYTMGRAESNDPMFRDELGLRHVRWANLLAERGRHDAALTHARRGRSILEPLYRLDPHNAAFARDLARAYNASAAEELHAKRLRLALEESRRGARVGEEALASGADDDGISERLADSYEVAARVRTAMSDVKGALLESRKAMLIRQNLAERDPSNARSRLLLALSYIGEGDVLVAATKPDPAKQDYASALAILQPMAESDPINVLKRRALADARSRLERLGGERSADALAVWIR